MAILCILDTLMAVGGILSQLVLNQHHFSPLIFTTLSNLTHLRALAGKTDYLVIVVIYDQTYVFMFCFVFFFKKLILFIKRVKKCTI